jgi:hypothetical protein
MSKETKKTDEKKKAPKQEAPDYLYDAVAAVEAYDKARLAKAENVADLHAKAVKKITTCNNFKGPGYISISKARTITQAIEHEQKVQFAAEKAAKAA